MTHQEKKILLENIEGNTTWFNKKEKEIFNQIKRDVIKLHQIKLITSKDYLNI